MSSSFEKSVKGGTKVKLAAPKSKYVEHILSATHSGEAGVGEVFRTLTLRLRDTTWTIVFKALIIVHLMIKEGSRDVTLSYLSQSPKTKLAINHFTDVQTQGQNIRRYSEYLLARALAYGHTKCDFVRSGDGRMRKLTVDKGLLRETEIVQDQVRALLKCDLLQNDVAGGGENEITLTAFRLLTKDILDLYNCENEAVMNVLSRYFEMSKSDAERAINIYRRFCKQTDMVVQYLSLARQYEHATRLEIPRIKHAPTSLVQSLQEYLDDKDFEVNRRQYLAEQEAKRTGKPVQKGSTAQPASQASSQPAAAKTGVTPSKEAEALFNSAVSQSASQPTKGPAPDLIDFFESIEQNQQPMAQPQFQQQQPTAFSGQQQQQYGFAPQQTGFQQDPSQAMNGFPTGQTNPFMQQQQPQQQQQQQQPQPLQTQFTGAGFGGYGPQPPQQFVQGNAFGQDQQHQQFGSPMQIQSPGQMTGQQQQQQTNPFRQSTMPTISEANQWSQQAQSSIQRQPTNPFARNASPQSAFSPQPQQQQQQIPQQQQQQPSPFATQQHQQQPSLSPFAPQQTLQPQPTGTNPFARSPQPTGPPAPVNAIQVQPTGSTNPFRQSAFVNPATGQGWQNGPQGTVGGWDNVETVAVFPRPGGGG